MLNKKIMETEEKISSNWLEKINVIMTIICFISLVLSITGDFIAKWEYNSIIRQTTRIALWLTLSYINVFDPLLQNKKKGNMFWIFLIIMTAFPIVYYLK